MAHHLQAIVVLPAVMRGRIADASVRRWLSRSRLRECDSRYETLTQVLEALNLAPVASGLAALRLWGQTGTRPSGWTSAADPVYLEARLDYLCLHALQDVTASELQALFEHLEETLARGRPYSFRCLDSYGYLESQAAMATAGVPAAAAHGRSPGDFPLDGPGLEVHDALQSELQMSLHDCAVNRRRAAAGRLPVNSLWLWGGGMAPDESAGSLPILFSDDPLVSGYWLRSSAAHAEWPGSLHACVEAADRFVAVPPGIDAESATAESCLVELRDLMRRGRITQATLLFRDGLQAAIRRRDSWRVWRCEADCLLPGNR
jgi:hypothetical protein